jgi:hypothetical protein
LTASTKDSHGQGRPASTRTRATVRTMFGLYTLLIAGGIVLFVIVGLTQQ